MSALPVRAPVRGAASLGVVVVLLAAASLVVLYVNRALVFEQRISANQARSTVAFEAAEAGVEWALAALGHAGPLDPHCEPGSLPGDGPLRERLLQWEPATNQVAAGSARAGCSRGEGGAWQCSCPASGGPEWPAGTGAAAGAFSLRVEPASRPGSFRLVATGCANPGSFCAPDQADALATATVSVAALPLLAHPPATALAAGGAITLGTGTLVANTDAASGGYAATAGDSIQVEEGAQLLGLPGRPPAAAVAANDASLREASVPLRFLGLGPGLYRELPGVKRLACATACRAQQASAAWAAGTQPVLWIDGDLDLDAGLPLGTAQAPVLLVVAGQLRISSAVEPWGLAVARSVAWSHPGGGIARWHGALVAQEGIALAGGAQVIFDAAVLQRLGRLKSFVRIPGGWHDGG
jgi:hypothetical protein